MAHLVLHATSQLPAGPLLWSKAWHVDLVLMEEGWGNVVFYPFQLEDQAALLWDIWFNAIAPLVRASCSDQTAAKFAAEGGIPSHSSRSAPDIKVPSPCVVPTH